MKGVIMRLSFEGLLDVGTVTGWNALHLAVAGQHQDVLSQEPPQLDASPPSRQVTTSTYEVYPVVRRELRSHRAIHISLSIIIK